MPKRIDLTGQKINELRVLGYSHSHIQPSGQKRAIWDVQCSCGVVKKMSTGTLMHGSTVSCGHIGKVARQNARRNPDGVTEQNYLFLSYKKRAQYSGLDFKLEKERFVQIVSLDCHYCGDAPANQRRSRAQNRKKLFYSGIDRVDNNQGYIEGNVVPCCKTCNYMKSNNTIDQFISHVQKVTEHVKKRLQPAKHRQEHQDGRKGWTPEKAGHRHCS